MRLTGIAPVVKLLPYKSRVCIAKVTLSSIDVSLDNFDMIDVAKGSTTVGNTFVSKEENKI
jgi:hypothetical protein